MSMVLIGRRLSSNELRAVLDDPSTVDSRLFGDLDDRTPRCPTPSSTLARPGMASITFLTRTPWEVRGGPAGGAGPRGVGGRRGAAPAPPPAPPADPAVGAC